MYRFRECREQAQLTQKYVAISLGIKPPSVSDWEKGNTKPTIENLISMAKLYHVSVDYLLGVSEVPVSGIVLNVKSGEKNRPTKAEEQLLCDFRSLNDEGQDLILKTMYTICMAGVYKKSDNLPGVEAK